MAGRIFIASECSDLNNGVAARIQSSLDLFVAGTIPNKNCQIYFCTKMFALVRRTNHVVLERSLVIKSEVPTSKIGQANQSRVFPHGGYPTGKGSIFQARCIHEMQSVFANLERERRVRAVQCGQQSEQQSVPHSAFSCRPT